MTEAVGEGIWTGEDNDETTAAWDGPLFEVWRDYRDLIEGGRCLDIGCGFGDTTFRMAELVGAAGHAHGVDVAPRMIEVAQQDLEREGTPNVSFGVSDVESDDLGETYDYAFGRCGVMFFANPVPAFRNVRQHLAPGGLLNVVVWRRKLDNDWLYRAQQIVERIVPRPEDYDEPTCGPGPFSMADADTTGEILVHSGFTDIAFRRTDIPILIGRDVEEAIDMVTAIGPAGEILRLAGDRAAHLHDEVREALREGLSEFQTPDGVRAPASTWIVTATA